MRRLGTKREDGRTDPEVLLAYLRKGVSVWSQPGLHAKAIARGQVAVVGSANSSNASADGYLAELVAILRRRPAVAATRDRIEVITRIRSALDPVTLSRLSRLFKPGREFQSMRKRAVGERTRTKARAWCIGTHYTDEHADVEKARSTRCAASRRNRLSSSWAIDGAERIGSDDDISWSGSTAGKFELGDQIFEVIEEKTLKPPGVLVHKEASNSRHGFVLFICRGSRNCARPVG